MLKYSHAVVVHIVVLGLTLAAPMAQGLTFVVDTTEDRLDDDIADNECRTSVNTCSLRAAMMQANHVLASTPSISILLPAGNFVLTRAPVENADEETGDLNLATTSNPNQRIGIYGAGAASTIIDANQLHRALHVEPGRTAYLTDVTVRNGYPVNDFGGGIFNEGTLTITRCVIEANKAVSGGGIFNTGALEIIGSTVRSNFGAYGGGVALHGVTTMRNSTLYDNGSALGGAVYVWSGNIAQPTLVYIVNSTLSNNWANINGGGIYALNQGDPNNSRVFVYSTSIVSNDADHDHDEAGGIGGGVYVSSGARLLTVNSLIAGNTQQLGTGVDDCFGTLEVYGYNLLDDLSNCSFSGNGTTGRGLVSLNTIGALQDNGGPTLTHALLAGSQAIDATNNQGCIDETGAPLATDQRGAPRGAGLDCDIGAFEYGAIVPVDDRIFANAFE